MRGDPPTIVTPEVARSLLRPLAPDAVVTDVVSCVGGRLGGGSNAVYEIRCAPPSKSVIIKAYAHEWRWKLAKEVFVYRLLASHGVGPVPTILHVGAQGAPGFDWAYSIMTLLDGTPLSLVSLTDPDARHVYQQLGGLLADMHRIGQPAYGYLTTRVLDPQPNNAAYMTREFGAKLRRFTELDGDRGLRKAARAFVARRIGLLTNSHAPTVCHFDFHEGNVLVAHNAGRWHVTGVLDVENAIAADPMLDLAKTDYFAVRDNLLKRHALLEGYGPLPIDWDDRLALYRLYHALDLWNWFAEIDEPRLESITDDVRRLID